MKYKENLIRAKRFTIGTIVIRDTFEREEFLNDIVIPLNRLLREYGYGKVSIRSSSTIRKSCSMHIELLSNVLDKSILFLTEFLENLGIPKFSYLELSFYDYFLQYDTVTNKPIALKSNFVKDKKINIGQSTSYNHNNINENILQKNHSVELSDEDVNALVAWADKYKLAAKNNEIDPWFPRTKKGMQELSSIELDGLNIEELPKVLFKLKNIQHIYMPANKICFIPKEIKNLHKLRKLYLHNNQFKEFPMAVLQCEMLESLSISDNSIGELSPEFFESFPKLTTLQISNIGCSILPKEFSNFKHLWTLDVSRNKIKTLPIEISNMITLDCIDLSVNELSTIPKEIGKLKVLDSLNLAGNPIKEIPKQCQWMIDDCVIDGLDEEEE
jgi:hypothetical protein